MLVEMWCCYEIGICVKMVETNKKRSEINQIELELVTKETSNDLMIKQQ